MKFRALKAIARHKWRYAALVAGFFLLVEPFAWLNRFVYYVQGNPAAASLHKACFRMPIDWLFAGEIGRFSGRPFVVLFTLGVLGSAFFLGPVFCGWLCPIGASSECLSRLFPRKLQIDLSRIIHPASLRYGFLTAFALLSLATVLPALMWMTDGAASGPGRHPVASRPAGDAEGNVPGHGAAGRNVSGHASRPAAARPGTNPGGSVSPDGTPAGETAQPASRDATSRHAASRPARNLAESLGLGGVCCRYCPSSVFERFVGGVSDLSSLRYWHSGAILTVAGWLLIGGILWKGGRGWCLYACPLGVLANVFHWAGAKIGLSRKVVHDSSKCSSCGRCEDACPTWAIAREGKVVDISRHTCNVCLECTKVCPSNALAYALKPR